MMKNYKYQLEFTVRDYECDLQGIVNNAVYQNYLEHTRHEFIKTLELDFSTLHKAGIDMVVARLEMSFQQPLTSGDKFICGLNIQADGIKYIFDQEIIRIPDMKRCIKAKVTTVARINGKLGKSALVDKKLFA